MNFTLNGIEIEVPEGASIEVSPDGKKVKIVPPKPEVVERIRVIQVPGEERVVERIKVVEVPQPCTLPHYPTYPSWPTYPNKPWITWGNGNLTGGDVKITTTGGGTEWRYVNGGILNSGSLT